MAADSLDRKRPCKHRERQDAQYPIDYVCNEEATVCIDGKWSCREHSLLGRMETALGYIEWIGGFGSCPHCCRLKESGHTSNCLIGKALAKKETVNV